MALTSTQLAVLAADIALQPSLVGKSDSEIADFYNEADPSLADAWRSNLSQDEVWDVMNWTTYIGRSAGERDAFRMLFEGRGGVNPSKVNVRQAFVDIFSGAGGATLRAALAAAAKRKMNRVERLFATDTDADGVWNMVVEGSIGPSDVAQALGR
jgi:hypothetical protein